MEQGRVGWNFQKISAMKNKFSGKFSKIKKCAGWNKAVQAGILQKIDKLCSTFIRQTRVGIICMHHI